MFGDGLEDVLSVGERSLWRWALGETCRAAALLVPSLEDGEEQWTARTIIAHGGNTGTFTENFVPLQESTTPRKPPRPGPHFFLTTVPFFFLKKKKKRLLN